MTTSQSSAAQTARLEKICYFTTSQYGTDYCVGVVSVEDGDHSPVLISSVAMNLKDVEHFVGENIKVTRTHKGFICGDHAIQPQVTIEAVSRKREEGLPSDRVRVPEVEREEQIPDIQESGDEMPMGLAQAREIIAWCGRVAGREGLIAMCPIFINGERIQ